MLIHLEKLGKSFGEKIVLHDVTASVEREDRIGIVGQNGAGKTTLLKILTGVYTDYDGEFSVTHGVTLGYLEQNAKLDVTLDIYGEMRSSFAPVLDAMDHLRAVYPNVMKLDYPQQTTGEARTAAADVEKKDLRELFFDFYTQVNGEPPSEEAWQAVADLAKEGGMEL